MTELSVQYGLQSKLLYKRMRAARDEAALAQDRDTAYLLRRRADMLRDMWRETRDTSYLLAHYYRRGRPRS